MNMNEPMVLIVPFDNSMLVKTFAQHVSKRNSFVSFVRMMMKFLMMMMMMTMHSIVVLDSQYFHRFVEGL